jgi:anthranilate synthase component I
VRRSIIASRCPLRVELTGDHVRVRALDHGAEALFDALSARLPSRREGEMLLAELPSALRSDACDDATRLRSPCVLDALRAVAGLVADAEDGAPIAPGIFGAIGYEIVDRFDSLPPRRPDPLGEPDASFVLATDQVLFDHDRSEVHVITRHLATEDYVDAHKRHARYLALLSPNEMPADRRVAVPTSVHSSECVADVTDAAFRAGVVRLKAEIRAGEIFQAVLSRGLRMCSNVDSVEVYAELRESNPSPYMFHLDLADGSLLGASPETFLRCEDGVVEVRPIAGTVPRGADEESDRRLALQLLLDPKEQAEHAMLLDLARNDICRVSDPGTCHVAQQFEVERFSHVQHLVSRVRGRLAAGLDALHAYRAAANMGTLTGAPKLRAMELIREIEPAARGFYGGAAGYLLQDGSFDSCIVIRSLRQQGDVYTTRAGAGVVLESDPERELEETTHKSRACVEAVVRATRRQQQGLAS